MLILKFQVLKRDKSIELERVVSCSRYDKLTSRSNPKSFEVITHVKDEDPELFFVGEQKTENPSKVIFDVCYVENLAGKTIDRIQSKR